MINVNNKKMIKQVADTSFKADKMRNLFAVIAIMLTTILFCGLFTIASSLLTSLEESTMRQVGGNSHGGFKYLTMEEYETLSKHPDIKEISYSVVLAIAENEELIKRQTEIRYANDALEAKMMFAMPTTGRLPEAKDEIAIDTLVLEKLGVPQKLGETVTLKYSVGGEQYTESFKLVGFWEGDIIMPASQAWLSKEYVEGILNQHDLGEDERVIGTINADVNFKHSWNIESKIVKVITESGYLVDEIAYGVNWAYVGGMSSMDAGTVLGIVIVVLMIVFCGYLMISNVFLISVTRDVQFYGLLKTVGTTGNQIKAIIRRQAIRISMVGIPIGLLFGCVIGGMLTPFVLRILNTNIVKVSVRLWVLIFAAVFALLTVFISIQKAAKMASKISPMEALRTADVDSGAKRKCKSGQKICLWKMACDNVGRNRKKVILVTTSLSLSLIILNGAYSMADSFDMEKYLNGMISHDFVIGDVSWFNVYAQYTNQDTVNERFLEELSTKEGIESLEKIYFSEAVCELDEHWDDMAERASTELDIGGDWIAHMNEEIESGKAVYHVYGIDDAIWEELKVWQGEIDLEKLYTGKYVVVSPYDSEGRLSAYEVGDSIEVFSKNGECRNCEIIAIASIPYNISIQHSHPVDINIFVPSDVFLKQVEQKTPMLVTLDVEEGRVDAIEQFMADYCETKDRNMQYSSRAVCAAEYESTQRTYKVVGTVLSALLALIGIANFANTSITSIMARKREFAVLESIGMTKKQQRNMLVLESAIYMILTLGVTWTIGVWFGNCGLQFMVEGSEYFTINFTILPSVVCMPAFFILSVAIPILSQQHMNHESVVERLRMAESL